MNGNNLIAKLGKSKKRRIGALSAGLCALFIGALIALNGIFSVLSNKFVWFVDMTEEAVFTLSDAAKGYITDITKEINIYFAADPDLLMSDYDMRYVYTTACQLQSEFSNIHVFCEDVVKNPEYFKRFQDSKGTEIHSKSVIVESGSESVVSNYKTFFTYNENGERWAYSGEYRFISNIMRVTQNETPVAYFTTIHSEDKSENLQNLLSDSGFDVREINLREEDIDDDARLVVINNPKFDFLGIEAELESANEIKKLDDFLDGLGGLMVFVDPEYADSLGNLTELLEEWGIKFRTDGKIKDSNHAMSVDGYTIVCEYPSDDNLGDNIYGDLANFDSMPQAVLRNAMPIEILWEGKFNGTSTRYVYPMLKSYSSSELIDGRTGSVMESDAYNVMTISREVRVIDNDHYYSYVLATGTSSVTSDSYFKNSNAFGNSDILRQASQFIGRNGILADIDLKPFDDTTSTATTLEARNHTILVTALIPSLIAVCGIVVLIRRRHS